jgi:hypothetical protein
MATSIRARMVIPLLLSVPHSNPSWRLLSKRARLAGFQTCLLDGAQPVVAVHRPSLVWRASEYYGAQGTASASKSGTP